MNRRLLRANLLDENLAYALKTRVRGHVRAFSRKEKRVRRHESQAWKATLCGRKGKENASASEKVVGGREKKPGELKRPPKTSIKTHPAPKVYHRQNG